MSIKIGLVGAPNKGKSTFFKAATLKNVDIANYPFTTIEPNVGVAFVSAKCPCGEFSVRCSPNNSKCINGTRFIPVELIDIAGLVPDAHQGKGMGNKFLDDIRQSDVLLHIIDCSGKTDEKGESAQEFDVSKEVEFLETEIGMWLLSKIEPNWLKFARQIKQHHAEPERYLEEQLTTYNIAETHISDALDSLRLDLSSMEQWSSQNIKDFVFLLRSLSKPIVVVANKMDVPSSAQNLEKLRRKHPKMMIIPCSAEAELALKGASEKGFIEYIPGSGDFKINESSSLTEKQKSALEFLKSSVLGPYGSTGVQKALNTAIFDVMEQIVVYPVENETRMSDKSGNVLPDAILIKRGSSALNLAFKVHTDIGESFIRAVNVRTKQVIGKDYVLKDSDIIKIIAGK